MNIYQHHSNSHDIQIDYHNTIDSPCGGFIEMYIKDSTGSSTLTMISYGQWADIVNAVANATKENN